jgi:hypothetical protein
MGASFSGCMRNEHTLYVLFEKDSNIMRKRIICPAMVYNFTKNIISHNCNELSTRCDKCKENCKMKDCYKCYSYIHFKNIRMGYISSDEFLYYLLEQIRLFANSQKIKRIILDDLQIIDYSFPLLKRDKLFLTALISVCKENEIDLFILCDKNASKVQELRVLADNVICTEKKNDQVQMYIERFYSYNEPSHTFGFKILRIKDLFYCETKHNNTSFSINANCIDEITIPNMEDYWSK